MDYQNPRRWLKTRHRDNQIRKESRMTSNASHRGGRNRGYDLMAFNHAISQPENNWFLRLLSKLSLGKEGKDD